MKKECDMTEMSNEYYDWPKELYPSIKNKKMLFVYNKQTSDVADIFVGGGDFVRGQVTELGPRNGKTMVKVKTDILKYLTSSKAIKKGDQVFISAAGFKRV